MKYHISAEVRGSKYIGTFEANSPEEAIELAWKDRNLGCYLCHQCIDECEDPEIYELFVSEDD